MTEEPKEPVETPPADPVKDEPKAVEPFKAYATKGDYDAHKAKLAEADQREIASLRKKIEAKETADEKAQRESEDARKAELDDTVALTKKHGRLASALMANGKSEEQAWNLVSQAGDWKTAEEGMANLEEALGVSFSETTTKPVGGGGGRGSDDPEPSEITEEHAHEMMNKYGPTWLTPERRAKMQESRRMKNQFRRL